MLLIVVKYTQISSLHPKSFCLKHYILSNTLCLHKDMAAAYAALVSLTHVLNRTQHPACPVLLDKPQLRSLHEKVSLLLGFVEDYSQTISKDFAKKITDAVFAIEDVIETYVVDEIKAGNKDMRQILASNPLYDLDVGGNEGEDCYGLLCQYLDKAIRDMDMIIQESVSVKEKNDEKHVLPKNSAASVGSLSSGLPINGPIKMVGFEEELARVLGELTRRESRREIIPLAGMGGIGKTTLARSAYDHPRLTRHFDVRAWVTISQVYTTESIIIPLLREISKTENGQMEINDTQLGEQLHKSLWGRKYIIVLDDIWDSEAWDKISRFCPDNKNGSRILLTTRRLDLARSIGSCDPYEMNLLDDDKSWDLLSKSIFRQQACPAHLENIGKKIAKSCKGLPLAIVVIGGLLNVSDKTQEYWENVERNISSIISKRDNELCLKILSLSYHQLPIHLKPCFLYLATFPEDQEIRVSELIMVMSSDGFIKPKDNTSLEDVALEYLKDLTNRNLITVKSRYFGGALKSLTMHDLVRDICVVEAQKERFLSLKGCSSYFSEPVKSQRRLVNSDYDMLQKGLSRSFIWKAEGFKIMPFISGFSLLRVMIVWHVSDNRATYSPMEILQFVNLRFIKFILANIGLEKLSLIPLLWNLETLIVDMTYFTLGYILPREIWKLPHIKHLIFFPRAILPDPPTGPVLENLQTLERIVGISDRMLNMIPNIKKLQVFCEEDEDLKLSPGNQLVHCQKLETLKLYGDHITTIQYPSYLRRLVLGQTKITWENMTTVGSLPNLEVLKLKRRAVVGKEWETCEGEFQQLKFLSMDTSDLKTWIVEDSSHFPCLEHLKLIGSDGGLKEIPQVLGELTREIELHACNQAVCISAWEMLQEQQNMGNYDLTVEVFDYDRRSYTIELDSLKNDNFHFRMTR